MAAKTRLYSFFGKDALKGGLNVSDNPIIVPPYQMVIADNVAIKTTLGRKKRGGVELFNTNGLSGTGSYPAYGTPYRGLFSYFRYSTAVLGTKTDLFCHHGTKVYSIADRTSAAIDRTGAVILDPLSIPSYQVFDNILYFVSDKNADGYNYWDGDTASIVAAVPGEYPVDGIGTMLQIHQGRMWMAGVPGFPYRLYYSRSLDPLDWSSGGPAADAGGSIDLTAFTDPEGITAIFPSFEGSLFVATRKTVFEIKGFDPTNFVVRPFTRGIGCVSHNAVVATPNDIFFPSDRGYHSLKRVEFGDALQIDFASLDVQNIFTKMLNPPLLKRMQAVWAQDINSIVITVVGGGVQTNNLCLVYNLQFNAWTNWTGIDARSLCVALVNNREQLLFGREDGKLGLYNDASSNDFGVGYTMHFRTGVLYPDSNITTEKSFMAVTILASTTKPSSINVGYLVDGKKQGSHSVALGSTEKLLGSTFIMGQTAMGVGTFFPYTQTIGETGYGIQIDITSGGTGDMEVYGFILEANDVNPNYS